MCYEAYASLNIGGGEAGCLDVERQGTTRERAGGLRANMESGHDHRSITELLLLSDREHLARLRSLGLANGVDDVGSHLRVQTTSYTNTQTKNKVRNKRHCYKIYMTYPRQLK